MRVCSRNNNDDLHSHSPGFSPPQCVRSVSTLPGDFAGSSVSIRSQCDGSREAAG